MTLFASLWAVVALFHVLTSGHAEQIVSDATTLGLSYVLLAMCAFWLLARPAYNLPLMLVAVLGLVTAWQEAPILGNHWLLVAFVDLALLLSAPAVSGKGGINRDRLAEVFLPLARWCLVLFYSFAAFAKLNSAFFDTAVSCGTYYFDETARSWGFDTPLAVGAGGPARLLPFVTVVTELSIPALLLNRRTRSFGVVLGLCFHSLIALDRLHQFVDFSSVLAALFVLFLPARFAASALGFLKGRGARLLILWVALASLVIAAEWIGSNIFFDFVFLEGRFFIWYVFDATILLGVVMWSVRHRRQALERPFTFQGSGSIWLAVVPVLLVVNGLLPYFELRTAYAFTMYSNLRMVDGMSNHLIVGSSLPLASRQVDLVKVVASSDPGLGLYATDDYLLPWDSFRAYLAEHPEVAIIYERGGKGYVVHRASDDPELVTPPPLLVQKLLAMRAVDGNDEPRCQDVFFPAL
ncbi:MAG: hypothetical protein JO364_07250 [Pseudonocardiales bacterium]|nr:hypothetical protein [Pseudonocardiales bacterium]MBV9030096.1 hypothetical protein [Pseudonocardiales bacterium]